MTGDFGAADYARYDESAVTDRMNARLAKVTPQCQHVDATTTVVSMKGWGCPRNVSYVGQYWGNEAAFEIDWYRQAALIVTLPQGDNDRTATDLSSC